MIVRLILMLSVTLQPIEVENFLFNKGMKVKVQMVRLGDPLIYGTQEQYFQNLLAAFEYKGYRHVLTNPFMQGKTEWISGFASKSFSTSVWNEKNDRGEDRRLHSLSALAHELGHTIFRLKHSGTSVCKDLMDSNVLACPNLVNLTFNSAQRLKIRFVNKYRRKKG